MTISVVYVTNRVLYPFLEPCLKPLSQYETLSESLKNQSYKNFELVVVDQLNSIPRTELSWLGDRVKYVRPRDTPWRRLGLFCPASARNSGLRVATGDVVLGMDDCVSFSPNLLESVMSYANTGVYLAPAYGISSDVRAPSRPRRQERCGGILSYPRAKAVELGMHEERFDGTRVMEDWEFSERLIREGGVEFVMDNVAKVVLHRHNKLRDDGRIIRCGVLVRHLLKNSKFANTSWTQEQAHELSRPCLYLRGSTCQLENNACKEPNPMPQFALDVMKEYEMVSSY